MLSYLYPALASPRAHNAGQRVGSNWIWLQESYGICTWNWQDWSPYTEGLSGTNTGGAYPANSRGFCGLPLSHYLWKIAILRMAIEALPIGVPNGVPSTGLS
jgi:hypothetical protein